MKIKLLESHDRLLEFVKQSDYIEKGCQDCINNRPEEFLNYPFYIFAHKRQIPLDEKIIIFNQDLKNSILDLSYVRQYNRIENVPEVRFIWSPRLTKPKAQSNSLLFKVYPPEQVRPIWIIPEKELWGQYKKGNLIENELITDSIYYFNNYREKLEVKEEDDLSDEKINDIYRAISLSKKPRQFI